MFELDGTKLVSKLIEGTYPNFRQVIPTETKERVPLERELLLAALRRASILASEKSQSVKLNFAKNTLTITATTLRKLARPRKRSPSTTKARKSTSLSIRNT